MNHLLKDIDFNIRKHKFDLLISKQFQVKKFGRFES